MQRHYMVKYYFFEVTQNKFDKLIWLLKVYMPSNKTEAVLFRTKNEKADPNMGVNYTPKFGCFFSKLLKYSFFVALLLSS